MIGVRSMLGAGEMANWLRALVALPDVLSSIAISHKTIYKRDLMSSSGMEVYMQTANSYINE